MLMQSFLIQNRVMLILLRLGVFLSESSHYNPWSGRSWMSQPFINYFSLPILTLFTCQLVFMHVVSRCYNWLRFLVWVSCTISLSLVHCHQYWVVLTENILLISLTPTCNPVFLYVHNICSYVCGKFYGCITIWKNSTPFPHPHWLYHIKLQPLIFVLIFYSTDEQSKAAPVYSWLHCTEMWWQRTGSLFLSRGLPSGGSLAKLLYLCLIVSYNPASWLTNTYTINYRVSNCAFQCVLVPHQQCLFICFG